jgi:hypothetical protein
MKRTQRVKLKFNAEDVKAALETAGNEGLLCGTCIEVLAQNGLPANSLEIASD